jgi:multicomponent Na+:H+ antiporter subunit D
MGGAWLDLARVYAPLLVVTAPLAGAALAVLVAQARVSWVLAALGALVCAAVSVDLAARFLLGGAEASWRADGAGLFASALVSVVGALTIVGAGATTTEGQPRAAPFALALMLATIAGWNAALLAADLSAAFVAVEIAWLANVMLIALGGERDRAALNGAFRMLVTGGAGAALMLFGIGLIGRSVGTTQVALLAEAHIISPGLTGAGVGLVLLGLALKAGVAPFHFWLGAAFGRSGGAAATMVGAVTLVGALGMMVRVGGYALAAPALGEGVAACLAAIGVASVVIGSLQAIGSRNLRRMAAYAGLAQAGCVLLSVALGSPAGFAAGLVQVFALAAAALALFAGAAAIGGVGTLASLDGLGRRAPLASIAISVGALSLMGAPLTIGFLGRWRMIEAGVGVGWWWAAGAVIAASLAAVFYGGRLIERLYFRKSSLPFEGNGDGWRVVLLPALLAPILAIGLGLEPALLLRAADAAAALMTGHVQ